MAHLLTPAPTTAATPLSARPWNSSSLYSLKNACFTTPRVCCIGNQYQHQVSNDEQVPHIREDYTLHRRRALMGLSGAVVLGLSWREEQSARAAARRPPPPPPKEKKDPNISAVQAKVLASKKRKEALKEEVARLREKGKAVNINKEPPPPAVTPTPIPASE
ncbi:uncharacterized protein LOC127107094 [Lathyrus oleraceus]|nr:uncharacterized protein LOC127107094 [Pisum sativum]KAI5386815.1 hypothetical protein KIW84_073092 [Pisum sativum]